MKRIFSMLAIAATLSLAWSCEKPVDPTSDDKPNQEQPGNTDTPVIIKITNEYSNKSITIRDYGTGLSPERFKDIYLNIGNKILTHVPSFLIDSYFRPKSGLHKKANRRTRNRYRVRQ